MKKSRSVIRYFQCPHCGEQVREGAAACPHCGSDDETGWGADDAEWEEDFDYDEFVKREFSSSTASARYTKKEIFVRVIVFILLVLFLWPILQVLF